MPKGLQRFQKTNIVKLNALEEIIDELALKYGVDRNKMARFINRFTHLLFKKTTDRYRASFRLYVWGDFTVPKIYGKNRRYKKSWQWDKVNRPDRKEYQRAYQLEYNRKKKMKIVNNLFLSKLANELNYILSLYK